MTYAKDDSEWQGRVLARCGGQCLWPGCNSTWGLAGHHVIDRRYKELRLVVENGVALCVKHHGLMHDLGILVREKASRLLIGDRVYAALQELLSNRGVR